MRLYVVLLSGGEWLILKGVLQKVMQLHCTMMSLGGSTIKPYQLSRTTGTTDTKTDLHIGFLNEADPELITAAGIRTQWLSMGTHWQTVIDCHLWKQGDNQCGTTREWRLHHPNKKSLYILLLAPTFLLVPLSFKQTRYFPLGLIMGSPLLFCGQIHLCVQVGTFHGALDSLSYESGNETQQVCMYEGISTADLGRSGSHFGNESMCASGLGMRLQMVWE